MTAYGIENIMTPLEEGDLAPMRAAFPEVPTVRLATAGGEVSLLVGQNNLSLFPTEWRRVGNAALLRSLFRMGWIASGRPLLPKTAEAREHYSVRELLSATAVTEMEARTSVREEAPSTTAAREMAAREHKSKRELLCTTAATEMEARKHQSMRELLSATAATEMEAREHKFMRELLSTTAAIEMAAREHQSERELLSTTAAGERQSEWELLSMAAKRPREKQQRRESNSPSGSSSAGGPRG